MTPFELLHQCLEARVGIAVKTTEPDKLRAKLYAERQRQQKSGVYIFDEISFFELPDGELWIVHHDILRQWRSKLEQDVNQTDGESL